LLFTKIGLVNKTRKKGSTDKEVLKSLEGQHPVVPLLLELRSATKTRGTYIDGTLKRVATDGRVHSFFTLYKTVTGRLSSRNPNLQNIPRESKIKQIFCAAPGNVLIEADYKGAELRVLAYLSGDKSLTQVFLDGRDPHVEVAIELYGKDFTDDQKIRAKAVNFGIAYGRTEFSLAREYGISLNEALAMIDKWAHMYPDAWEYLLGCDEDARTGKVLVTPFGRKRRFGLITQEKINELENEARNFRVQNIASDLNLLSAMNMEQGLLGWGFKLVNLVHDSIVSEGNYDLDLIKHVSNHMKHIMSASPKKYLNTDIPFVADVKIGYTWGALTKEKDFWKELE
jgi:DNA polymerase-1